MINGTVAIVGRANVGKSSIFNRMIEQRLSIVDDTPGVTRDRIYGECNWLGKNIRLIDTGGIQLDNAPFQTEINAQVDIAIEEADVILFVVNGQDGVTNDDKYIVKLLYKSNFSFNHWKIHFVCNNYSTVFNFSTFKKVSVIWRIAVKHLHHALTCNSDFSSTYSIPIGKSKF